MTVISHDSEATMHVTGYEPRESYVRDVHYIATGYLMFHHWPLSRMCPLIASSLSSTSEVDKANSCTCKNV